MPQQDHSRHALPMRPISAQHRSRRPHFSHFPNFCVIPGVWNSRFGCVRQRRPESAVARPVWSSHADRTGPRKRVSRAPYEESPFRKHVGPIHQAPAHGFTLFSMCPEMDVCLILGKASRRPDQVPKHPIGARKYLLGTFRALLTIFGASNIS